MIKNDKTSILFVTYERSCGDILTNTGIIVKLRGVLNTLYQMIKKQVVATRHSALCYVSGERAIFSTGAFRIYLDLSNINEGIPHVLFVYLNFILYIFIYKEITII